MAAGDELIPPLPRRGRRRRQTEGRGRVLVTDLVNARSRSAVAAVRALAAGGFSPWVTRSGGRSPAASSRDCAGDVTVPGGGGPAYASAVRAALADGPWVDVLPASDEALLALQRPGGDLVDKSRLTPALEAAGLRSPRSTRFADAEQLLAAAPLLEYPVVVKPVVKSGPQDQARRAGSPHELAALASGLRSAVVVQPYLRGPLRAVSGVVHEGQVLALVHQRAVRTWPVDCGVASCALTVEPDLPLEERLLTLLAGHTGVFQVQLLGEHVIDVNPRVYGSLPLAVAAGANLPAIACAAVQGDVHGLVRARPGVRYRWLEGDLRSLRQGVRTGATSPAAAALALLPRPRTAHSVESLRDPLPLVERLVHAAGRSSR